ncbi:MAG: hypothetical protein DMG07_14795 [Acidobacteria bacterium]|nr:MAG: hypothetical protein DMG07_14795 [Acidobacteriota bacterium]
MSCQTTQSRLEAFLSGRLSGEESRSVRLHLASCRSCAQGLGPVDRIEILAASDAEVEPSADFAARFRARLESHRAQAARPRWSVFSGWSLPRQLAAAGALAGFLALGVYLGVYRLNRPGPAAADIAIAENLPLLRDMKVIENLDLLEDFDAIQGLQPASTVQ